MKILPLTLLTVLIAACGSQVPQVDDSKSGLKLDCHSRRCPALEDLQAVLEITQEKVPLFNPDADLLIDWHASEEVFFDLGGGSQAIGYTESESKIVTTSYAVLAHELMHLHYQRLFGDGDADHAEGSGPWSEETEIRIMEIIVAIKDISDAFESTAPNCPFAEE